MDRRKFIGITGGTIVGIGATGYLLSDKSNLAMKYPYENRIS